MFRRKLASKLDVEKFRSEIELKTDCDEKLINPWKVSLVALLTLPLKCCQKAFCGDEFFEKASLSEKKA